MRSETPAESEPKTWDDHWDLRCAGSKAVDDSKHRSFPGTASSREKNDPRQLVQLHKGWTSRR